MKKRVGNFLVMIFLFLIIFNFLIIINSYFTSATSCTTQAQCDSGQDCINNQCCLESGQTVSETISCCSGAVYSGQCIGSYCGDGTKDDGEICDGSQGCSSDEECNSDCSGCINLDSDGDGVPDDVDVCPDGSSSDVNNIVNDPRRGCSCSDLACPTTSTTLCQESNANTCVSYYDYERLTSCQAGVCYYDCVSYFNTNPCTTDDDFNGVCVEGFCAVNCVENEGICYQTTAFTTAPSNTYKDTSAYCDQGNCHFCNDGYVLDNGVCIPDCASQGLTLCEDTCIDTSNDNDNCGGCNNVCVDGTNCLEGSCQACEVCPEPNTITCGEELTTPTNACSGVDCSGLIGTSCPDGQGCVDNNGVYSCSVDCVDNNGVCKLLGTAFSSLTNGYLDEGYFCPQNNYGCYFCDENFTLINGVCSPDITCVSNTWTPSTNEYCEGTSFTQTSNCDEIRTATGIKTTDECDVCYSVQCDNNEVCVQGNCVSNDYVISLDLNDVYNLKNSFYLRPSLLHQDQVVQGVTFSFSGMANKEGLVSFEKSDIPYNDETNLKEVRVTAYKDDEALASDSYNFLLSCEGYECCSPNNYYWSLGKPCEKDGYFCNTVGDCVKDCDSSFTERCDGNSIVKVDACGESTIVNSCEADEYCLVENDQPVCKIKQTECTQDFVYECSNNNVIKKDVSCGEFSVFKSCQANEKCVQKDKEPFCQLDCKGLSICNDECIDLQSDFNNCGSCNNQCSQEEQCIDASCQVVDQCLVVCSKDSDCKEDEICLNPGSCHESQCSTINLKEQTGFARNSI